MVSVLSNSLVLYTLFSPSFGFKRLVILTQRISPFIQVHSCQLIKGFYPFEKVIYSLNNLHLATEGQFGANVLFQGSSKITKPPSPCIKVFLTVFANLSTLITFFLFLRPIYTKYKRLVHSYIRISLFPTYSLVFSLSLQLMMSF